MYGIYKKASGLYFTGIIAKTEKQAWDYLDKEYGHEAFGYWYGVDRSIYEIKPLINISKKNKKKH